jgi:choline dehydrogenase-like flavoprotein
VRYFEENAIDAYHLGGGLAGPASLPEERVVSPIGRMLDLHNVFVMSTASFFAPGDANPVLTLLARVGVVLDEVTKGN